MPSTHCATVSTKRTTSNEPPLSSSLDATSSAAASGGPDGPSPPNTAAASAGSHHDDFWSSVTSAAQTTPAYQNVASVEGSNWEGQLPPGQAYQIPTNNHGPDDRPSPPPPSFDMSSPLHLSPTRRIDVRNFNDILLIDIRQFYKDQSGNVKPGTKGISMTVPQYVRLKAALATVDARIREHGGDPDTLEQPR